MDHPSFEGVEMNIDFPKGQRMFFHAPKNKFGSNSPQFFRYAVRNELDTKSYEDAFASYMQLHKTDLKTWGFFGKASRRHVFARTTRKTTTLNREPSVPSQKTGEQSGSCQGNLFRQFLKSEHALCFASRDQIAAICRPPTWRASLSISAPSVARSLGESAARKTASRCSASGTISS